VVSFFLLVDAGVLPLFCVASFLSPVLFELACLSPFPSSLDGSVLVGLASGEASDPEESITGVVLGAYAERKKIVSIHKAGVIIAKMKVSNYFHVTNKILTNSTKLVLVEFSLSPFLYKS
jgi:hypothetical protein